MPTPFFKNTLRQRSKAKPKPCTTIHAFLEAVQERTRLFRTKTEHGGYQPYRLFPQQERWLALFEDDKPKRRALLASRDKGKSQIVTILGSAWHLYRHRKQRIVIMSFSQAQATKFVLKIAEILEVMGVPLVKKAGGYYTDQAHTHTPSLLALGLMSNMRGLHCDILILDDPLTVNEQFSTKFIERSRFVMNEGSSVAQKIILIGQLLTTDDVYYDAYSDSSGHTFLLQSWHGDIPELDKDLAYEQATMGAYDVARNYLGYIAQDSQAIFSAIGFSDAPIPPLDQVCAFIDPSAKGHDATALALGWIHNARLIIKGMRFMDHWAAALEEIIANVRGCYRIYYEDNQGRSLGHFLDEHGIKAFPVTSTANKVAKILSIRPLVLTQRLLLHNAMAAEDVMAIKNWNPRASEDDLPDAIAMLVHKMGWALRKNWN